MTNQNKTWLQKYWKDLLLVITCIFVVFYVAVFSGVWADRDYKTNFWPDFFKWSGIILGVAIVAGWCLAWFGGNKNSK